MKKHTLEGGICRQFFAPENEPSAGTNPPADKTFTQAEFDAALTRVRGEEKTKWNEQVTAAKAEAAEASARITQLETKTQALTADLTAIREAKTEDGKTIDVEKLLERQASRLAKDGEKRMAELQRELEALRQENQTTKVERLRSKLIAQNGGEDAMIVELVSGDTVEEIEASIDKAKDAFEKAVSKYRSKSSKTASAKAADDEGDEDENSETHNGKATKPVAVPPELPETSGGRKSGGVSQTGTARDLQGVATMSLAEFAAKRNEIKKSVSQHLGGARPFTGRR